MVDNNLDYKEFLDDNIMRLALELVEWMEGEMVELNKSDDYQGSASEIKLFNALRGEEKSISTLARIMGISRQAVHKTTHRLEELGFIKLVSRQNNKKDRIVCITEKGQLIRKQGAEYLINIEEKLSWNVGERNLVFIKMMLSTHLKKLRESD
jgi:DNA-binding MarR family transcriptional regulator